MIRLSELYNGWTNFFFVEQPSSVIGLFRICMGLIIFIDSLFLFRSSGLCFGTNGTFPLIYWKISGFKNRFSLFRYLCESDEPVYITMVAMIISSFLFTIGFYTQLSSIVLFICWLSLTHRNVYIYHSGDTLCRLFIFLSMFSCAGYGLSLDNYINSRDQLYTMNSVWCQRLIMIQLTIVYWFAVFFKLKSNDWLEGSAIYYSLLNCTVGRKLVGPTFLKKLCTGLRLSSWLALAMEIFIGFGAWFYETRYIAIWLGICFHIFLEMNFRLGTFSWVMCAGLLLFLDPYDTSRFLESMYSCLQNNLSYIDIWGWFS